MDGAELEFGDTERRELLARLQNALSTKVPPTVWACLWLSDVGKLQELVTEASQRNTLVWSFFQCIEDRTKIVQHWCQLTRTRTQSHGQILAPDRRSKVARHQAHERDQKQCVLTRAGQPNEVAHIFPWSMRHLKESDQPSAQVSFWSALRMFWSPERVTSWYNAIFQQGTTETCHNLLCLAPNPHAYWTRAYFALKPLKLSDDNKELEVQLYWLSSASASLDPAEMDIAFTSSDDYGAIEITKKPSLPKSNCGPNLSRLWNHQTKTIIQSGDKITLTTDDPDLRPLPHFALLEMQWFLHRVAALSGAAEENDDVYSQSDSNSDGEVQDWETRQAWVDDVSWRLRDGS